MIALEWTDVLFRFRGSDPIFALTVEHRRARRIKSAGARPLSRESLQRPGAAGETPCTRRRCGAAVLVGRGAIEPDKVLVAVCECADAVAAITRRVAAHVG